MESFIGVGAIVLLVLLSVIVLISRYRTVSSDEVLIVSGSLIGKKNVYTDEKTGGKIKIVRGGGTFVFPIFQIAKVLSLQSHQLDVNSPAVYTKKGVPIAADGTVIIKIGSTVEDIVTAAEQYLSKSTQELREEAKQVLEGHLRAILGSMTVEEIYTDRDGFANRVQEVAGSDLSKMGLEIISFTVKDISDEVGYLNSLGEGEVAEARKNADVGTAIAQRETRIKRAEGEKEAQEAENRKAIEIASFEKERAIKEAEYKKEQDMAKAAADNAYALEKARLDKEVREAQMEVEIAERKKQTALEIEEAKRVEQQYVAQVQKKADADLYAAKRQAEAEKAHEVARFEAEAERIKKTGEAEADAIRLRGQAEAEVKNALAEALAKYGESAIATLLIENYSEIVRAAAEPISNIEKITVIDGGNGKGANQISGYATQTLASLQESLRETTGLDLTQLIKDFTGNKNVGAKVSELTEAIENQSSSEAETTEE